YDHEGRQQWSKPIPTPRTLYGMATSPIGYGDSLILVLDNDANLPDSKLSQSKILAIEKSTGETAWETPRPFCRSGWSTPALWNHGDGKDLVVLGSGRVSGYDPRTGVEKWFAPGFSRETIAIPVSGAGHVYASAAMLGGVPDEQPDPQPFWNAVMQFDRNGDEKLERSEMTGHFTFPIRPELPPEHPGYGIPLPEDEVKRRGRLDGMFGWVDKDKDGFWTRDEFLGILSFRRGKPMLMAIRPGGEGDVTESHVSWQLHRGIPEIPSPVFYENRLYLVCNGGLFTAVDAANGEIVYRKRLAAVGQYSASPVVAGDHLYLISERGHVSVVKPGDTFQLVHEYDLGEPAFVTPAFDASTIYIRTKTMLWALRIRD
ncbi:MAG: PQQ-binding-like beta-propeller repeat protein, partial [Thermoguttaceae bacterium]